MCRDRTDLDFGKSWINNHRVQTQSYLKMPLVIEEFGKGVGERPHSSFMGACFCGVTRGLCKGLLVVPGLYQLGWLVVSIQDASHPVCCPSFGPSDTGSGVQRFTASSPCHTAVSQSAIWCCRGFCVW